MSADNRICIMQNCWGSWAVWHGSMSEYYEEPPYYAETFESLEEAARRADAMEANLGYVEYGVQTIGPEEQEEALRWRIEDAQVRLNRLLKTGSQWSKKE